MHTHTHTLSLCLYLSISLPLSISISIYLYLPIYLSQAYVRGLIDAGENSWFPVARAMCLQQQSDEMNDRLTRIEDKLQTYE
jgi:hypothetical protein